MYLLWIIQVALSQKTQKNCIIFEQRRPNVFDVGQHCTNGIQMFCVCWDIATWIIYIGVRLLSVIIILLNNYKSITMVIRMI